MPGYGEKQKPAGVKLKTPERCKPVGDRTMRSKDGTIAPAFTVHNIPYKGNANLRAQD